MVPELAGPAQGGCDMALNPQNYDQIVQKAWKDCQQTTASPGGPADEAGRGGGQRMSGNQANSFARTLLTGLQQAGVSSIDEALTCAQQGNQRQA
jgi:hypothetical protein